MRIHFLSLLILLSTDLLSQKIPKFGKIDKEEILSTTCSYAPEADAEVLLDEGNTKFQYSTKSFFKMITERRIRIKIYNQKGMRYANVQLNYLSDERYERIYNIAAISYTNTDGKIIETKLEKNQVFFQKINDQFSQVSFGFPNVKPGSVIEYRYLTEKESFSNIDPWIFQREVPVRLSSFTLQIPEYFKFTSNSMIIQPLEKKETNETSSVAMTNGILNMGVTNFTYLLRNIPPLIAEPYMSSLKDYTQRIEFQLSEIITPSESYNYTTDWEKLAEELRYNKMFGEQIKKNIAFPDLEPLIQKGINNTEKIKILLHYFKKNYTWNGIHDFYALDLKKTISVKTGSSGDLNLLFLNMLKNLKIEAYPLLVSTKENGVVNMLYPFLKQFNSVNVYIPNGDTFFIINAADKYNITTLIPYDIINTVALKILKENCVWINLSDNKMFEKNKINYRSEVFSNGTVTGSAIVNSYGYAKPPRIELLQSDSIPFISKFLTHPKQNIDIQNLRIKNIDEDSLPLEQQFDFQTKLITNGDYSLLYYNLFSVMHENPFVTENRTFDIDFGYPRQFTINAFVNFSADYDFEELPGNIKLIMSDSGIVFERIIHKEENTITISLRLKIQDPVYYSTDYKDLRKFFQHLFGLLNEPIVLLKKKK